MDVNRTTESVFIGGPLAGRVAPTGQAVYRSAETGKALRTDYGDRWVFGHQEDGHEIEPNCLLVANKVAGIYVRQSSRTYWTAYVWGPALVAWLAAGRPDTWGEATAWRRTSSTRSQQPRRSSTAA